MFSNKSLSYWGIPVILNIIYIRQKNTGSVKYMPPPDRYKQVINTALNREISKISDTHKSVAPIGKAEPSKVPAQYLRMWCKQPC